MIRLPLFLRALLALGALSLASCFHGEEKERVAVGPPKSTESSIPWNPPVAGQGGGVLSAMPETPRR